MEFRERQQLVAQLEQVTELKDALKAFKLVDASLQITLGPDWLERVNIGNVIADINSVLAGFLVPDDTGKLQSVFREGRREVI